MLKEEVPALLPKPVEGKLYNFVLRQLAESGQVALEMEWVRLCTHKVALTREEDSIREKIENTFRQSGLQPPFFREVEPGLPGSAKQHREVMEWMLAKGILLKTKEEIYFHSTVMAELQNRLIAWLKENGEITTPQFKEMTGASRKYTIPLLEYFDAQKVTIRVGEVRKLRGSA
jgi:selenocysteine-specific elongation factor